MRERKKCRREKHQRCQQLQQAANCRYPPRSARWPNSGCIGRAGQPLLRQRVIALQPARVGSGDERRSHTSATKRTERATNYGCNEPRLQRTACAQRGRGDSKVSTPAIAPRNSRVMPAEPGWRAYGHAAPCPDSRRFPEPGARHRLSREGARGRIRRCRCSSDGTGSSIRRALGHDSLHY